MARPSNERLIVMLRECVGRCNDMLVREFPDLSPAEHAFCLDHASMLLHQSFHAQALVDQQMARAKKPHIIVPDGGPING
jgi:hypothetical protein